MSVADLELLLARWRGSYDGALGTQIEALGETLGDRLRLPTAQGEAAAAWTTQLTRGGADELTPLLVALDELLARAHGRVCWPCVEALASLPPDPRIGTFALAYIAGTKVPKQMTDKLQRRLFDLVERHGDDRAASAIEAAIPAYLSITQPRMRNLIAKVEKRIAAAPTQPRIDVPSADPRGDELLAAIYADPADDGHRQVYADWLLERGDPRGELISLQLQRAAGAGSPRALAREAALIKKHARTWYAAIWSALDPASVRFERGFLTACALHERLRATKGKLVMLRPEWATVESIELHHPVPLSPAMRSLRAIHGLHDKELGILDMLGLRRLDALGVRISDSHRRLLDVLARCDVAELAVEDSLYMTAPSPLDLLDELRALGDRAPRALAIVGLTGLWRKHRWRWTALDRSRLTRFSHSLRYRTERLELHREDDAWARVVIHVDDPRDYYDRIEELMWDRAWGLELAHLRDRTYREIVIVSPSEHVTASSLWRLCATLGPVRHERA